MLTNGHARRVQSILIECRERIVDKYWRTDAGEVSGRTERGHIVHALRRFLDPIAFCTIERHLLTIHRKEILPEELAEGREQLTKSTDDRIIPPHRIMRLRDIDDEHDRQREQE